ncbi:MAG: aminoacetone oxidase family FAD-binding enzyme [Bacilli bacterium]|jgi:predicted Rossmann fold flavoprotein|nr:aminoacetone oxidase family FAD-binding enzyme [Bacilli bacterium]
MKVIVIGGGASGIIAAIKASEVSDVTIIEGNSKIGKKILVTGNGRSNFWNESISERNYNEESHEFLKDILPIKNEVYNFLTNSLGITPTNKNGYLYPRSKTASSITTVLEKRIKRNNIEVIYDLKVTKITTENNNIKIELSDNTTMTCDKLIIATGGKAASKTGSDGSGYNLLKALDIEITPVLPALVPLIINDKTRLDWSGVRTDAKLSVYENNKIIKEELGELQLTNTGISGIVTFNISGLITSLLETKKQFEVYIDFLPEIEDISTFLEEKNKNANPESIEELLETMINYKLLNSLLSNCHINKNQKWTELSQEDKKELISTLKKYKINISRTEDFEKAQVTRGGVCLNEITSNFSLKKYPNIKVIGEILNVDGICGGYNLAFAFMSGYIAGSSIND